MDKASELIKQDWPEIFVRYWAPSTALALATTALMEPWFAENTYSAAGIVAIGNGLFVLYNLLLTIAFKYIVGKV